MAPLVYIIILVFNGRKWIDSCLSSVLSTTYSNYNVLVVDNASCDGSVELISDKFAKVGLIRNKKNYGFAEGNNIGMKYALKNGAEYVALLNQDTKVDSDWLMELVNRAKEDGNIGILSPMQYNYEGRELDNNFKKYIKPGTANLDFIQTKNVIGAAMLINKNLIRKIGYFDPLYFCYREETDFCRRAAYHNFKIGIVKKSKIYHWHSLLRDKAPSSRRRYLMMRNEFIYMLKDLSRPLVINLLSYFKWKLMKFIENKGILTGLLYFIILVIKQIPVFFYIPLIYLRRLKDKQSCLS